MLLGGHGSSFRLSLPSGGDVCEKASRRVRGDLGTNADDVI